ncbi:MAG: metal-sensitive transcriptional regulator [bacterium]|nr:metal-sensitive transcriptional regulator [bacterium]MDT8365508.1 metal-sensitive transcriptional regulator [bacterium]
MDHSTQIPRLNRIEGQIRGITRMIQEGRYCVDILTQVKSASNALAKVQENIFKAHLEGCVRNSLTGDDQGERKAKVDEILEILSKFR